ncbi:MAG: VWA domain-containing protein, partial [Myxococcales bacterium]|nr:VWA domain-containing protein [Myxococcales bacterium]
ECPVITEVPPDLSNYAAIEAVYAANQPEDETPTGESILAVMDTLLNDPAPGDKVIVLATDGEPDTCAEPNPQNGQPEAIAAVTHAYESGIRTYIISVGTDVGMRHLQDVANAGVGHGPGDPDAPFWVAGDDMGLRDALTAIIGGELSCVVTLEGMIQDPDLACTGTVLLNGLPVPCDDPNGWRVIDATHIELRGDACDTLQTTPAATLEATFPCDVVLI